MESSLHECASVRIRPDRVFNDFEHPIHGFKAIAASRHVHSAFAIVDLFLRHIEPYPDPRTQGRDTRLKVVPDSVPGSQLFVQCDHA